MATAGKGIGATDTRLELFDLLLQTQIRLVRTLGDDLESACDIPLIWYEVLASLGRQPDERLTMSEIATQTSLSTGGATRLIDRICEAGLVERQNCPTDRRAVHVALTDAGRAMVCRATSVHLEGVNRHITAVLDDSERDGLLLALAKIRDGLSPAAGTCDRMVDG